MMQTILIAVLTAAQAYLLGSVDTGILISKFVYHDDVRKPRQRRCRYDQHAAHLWQESRGPHGHR